MSREPVIGWIRGTRGQPGDKVLYLFDGGRLDAAQRQQIAL
ncbi:hypothetical protein [Streptomyces sp. NPDC002602]